MIRVDVEQNSSDWEYVRLGRPTASQFGRILTPKKLEYSSSAAAYRNQLLVEWLIGYKPEFGGGSSGYSDRGADMEASARRRYEFVHDIKVERVGFIMRDDAKVGGSPDGFVGTDGGVDFKCPAMHTHIGYMLNPDELVDQYKSQMQGYMYLSGRQWWDVMSYHPDIDPVERRIARDERYQIALASALDEFVTDLENGKRQLAEYRSEFATRREKQMQINAVQDGTTEVIDIMHLLERSIAAIR